MATMDYLLQVPAIDASSSSYPAILDIANIDDDPSILLDISGQARPITTTLKDVGCDEYTTGTITNRPLKLSDVGPTYLISTGIEQEKGMPNSFHLFQNYPNPFNPSTKISWQLPVSSWLTLKVFDVLGNEVVTLVDDNKQAGNYEVEFNALELSSGIYFYQLRAGNFIQTKKMIVVK